jgi:NADH-quinone oxidoreductase subunit E
VNDDYVEDLDVPTFEALMESMRKGQAPKVGSVIGRQGSAPKGGPKVLIDPKLYDGSRAAPTKIANAPKPAAE